MIYTQLNGYIVIFSDEIKNPNQFFRKYLIWVYTVSSAD